MKRSIFLLSVLMAFVLSANGQQNKYMLKPFDWSMHNYGDYQLQYMRKTPQGNPVEFIIANTKTRQRIFPLLDKANDLQKVEGNFSIALWHDCIFIKASDGYAKEFDGLVWMVPQKGKLFRYYRDKKWVSSYNDKSTCFSGVYKIEKNKKGKEELVPLVMDIEENGYSAVYPLGRLPYIVKFKNGESFVYNSEFQLINTYKGELLAGSEGVILYRDGGFTEFNEDLSQAATFKTEADGYAVFCKEGFVVWRNKAENRVKVYDKKGNELWAKVFEKVLLFNGGPFARYLAVKENGKWGAYLLDNTYLLPCTWNSAKDLSAVVNDFKSWSYSSYVKNFVSKKGEFETTQQFNERQNNPEKQKEYLIKHEVPKKFLESFNGYTVILGPYDADNEEFALIPTMAMWNGFKIKVPLNEAEAFKNAFMQMRGDALKGAKYGIKYDSIAIEEITFTMPDGGKSYTFFNK
ncbi:MAG: hypothetical protein J5604_00560 [Bacteroidales bacterium]|nr:hypothetical protein [Bacteroidales bacterium]